MITKDYSSHGLQLKIKDDNSSNYIEIIVENQQFDAKRRSFLSKFIIVLLIYFTYIFTFTQHKVIYHLILSTTCLLFLHQLLNLVEKQSIKLITNVGLEKSTKFYFNRHQKTFIPSANMSGIVINEVIYFVS